MQLNDDGIGNVVLTNSQTFESENVEVPKFNMCDYEVNMAATELNMGEYGNVAAAGFSIGDNEVNVEATKLFVCDYENVAAIEFFMGDYENVTATEFNLGENAEQVESIDVHMEFEEFQAFTYMGDDQIDVDELDSKDPDFKRVDWESTEDSESFGSFIDEEFENEVNRVDETNEEVEEIVEYERVKFDNEGEASNPRTRRVNPPPAKPIYDVRGRPQLDLYQLYDSHKHFRDVLIEYAILHGFEFTKIKASCSRQTYKCKVEGCPWKFHASPSPCKRYFMVKTFTHEHKCQAIRTNRLASSKWIARVLC